MPTRNHCEVCDDVIPDGAARLELWLVSDLVPLEGVGRRPFICSADCARVALEELVALAGDRFPREPRSESETPSPA